MRLVTAAAAVFALLGSSVQAAAPSPEVKAEARTLFAKIISFPTQEGKGAVPALARYLAGELKSAGFRDSEIEIVPLGETAGLIVRYPGRAGSTKPPVILMAHMDVVAASKEDWGGRDPYVLTEQDGVFFGRGVVDNKYGVLNITQTFMRLRREGFVPDRELILAFTGDEETTGKTAVVLAGKLKGAAYAINSDAGGGFRGGGNEKASYALQVAEKTYATYELTARNSGGHSSAPRPDNAIYDLAAGLTKIAAYRFDARWNPVTLESFRLTAPSLEGELGKAMARFAVNPNDKAALAELDKSWVSNELRTTCVATMLRGGHAENALPVAATATINCRIFPGQTIAQVRDILLKVAGNDRLEIKAIGEPIESDVSVPPAELRTALAKVLAVRSPGVVAIPYMEAGATDGLYYRSAGIPTLGVGGLFMSQGVDYNIHGNNERLPVAQFDDGLDHFYLLIKALAGGE
ncbi:MAG: M20/M25/M40 family metallo-hydrolase [Caulobacter sp.]|nr:M20/M25/M40 family metallo-hydrolase [Caulobacter sp.]